MNISSSPFMLNIFKSKPHCLLLQYQNNPMNFLKPTPILAFEKLQKIYPFKYCIVLLFICVVAMQSVGAAPKPPVLNSSNAAWWKINNKPTPKQGWDTFASNVKNYHPYIKQAVDQRGSLIFLINLRVNKKGRVDFAEIWDSNVEDSLLLDTIIQAVKYNGFTPLLNKKGKRLNETALVLMEIPGNAIQLETQAQDTTLPNKSIVSARFLGGDNAFHDYVSSEFKYPTRCLENGTNGYVRVRFMVNRNGRVTNCRIKETSNGCPEFAIEAVRIMKACPKWIPAKYNGQNISAWFEIPISLAVR